jgi:hypothetical protein
MSEGSVLLFFACAGSDSGIGYRRITRSSYQISDCYIAISLYTYLQRIGDQYKLWVLEYLNVVRYSPTSWIILESLR